MLNNSKLRRCIALLVLLAGTIASLPTAWATDVFGVPDDAAPRQSSAPAHALPLPDGVREAIGKMLVFQGEMNDALQTRVADLQHFGTPTSSSPDETAAPHGWFTLLELIGLCVGYGVLHALAPGHGKFVVASQFATRRARSREVMSLSLRIALGQSLAAIVLVGAVVLFARFVTQGTANGAMTGAGPLELISNVALVLVGLVAAFRIVTGRDCCTLDEPLKLARTPRDSSPGAADSRNIDEPGDLYLGNALSPASRGNGRPAFTLAANATPYRGVRGLGLATSLRPCAGALFVLLIASTAHVFWAGALAALSIGLGVAVTISLIGLGVASTTAFMLTRPRLRHLFERTQRGVALSGALLIALFGLLQIGLLATGVITLGPG